MQTLKQIAFLLDGNKLAKIDILDNQDSNSRYTQFYRLLKDGTIKTDEDAARHFYQTNDPKDSRYRYFKSAFKEKLSNVVFFVNTQDENIGDYQNAYSNAQKSWALINILFTRSAFDAAIDLSEKLLKICLHYEFTELIVQLTDRLKYYYGSIEGAKEKYIYLRQLHFKYIEYLNAEYVAKDIYLRIKVEYAKTIGFKSHMHDVANKAIEELRPYVSKCDSFNFMAFWYYLRIDASRTIYDHKNILAVCEEGFEFFKQKDFDTRKVTSILLNQQLISQIQLRRYEEGKVTAKAVLAMQVEGAHNWYKTLEQHMMLAFHTREYGQAYEVYQTAIKHKNYAFLTGRNKEIWALFSAYLYFLIKNKRVEGVVLEKSSLANFKLSKFSNDLNEISADKNGLNIPALIVNYLLQLVHKNEGKLIDGVETMQKYITRHVKKTNAAYRSNLFMRLLTHTTESDYSIKSIAPFAKKLMQELSEGQHDIMEQGDRIEILPYEYVWEEMQTSLKP
jgi:hypothetical protein